MPRYVYQLVASGPTECFGKGVKKSKTVFLSKEAAERRVEKFKEIACDPNLAVDNLEREKVQVEILELEIIED
jgi:hypothetical protein